MTQALQMATAQNIHVYVVDPGVSDAKLATDHTQLKLVASQTDGDYFMLVDGGTVNSLVSAITRQEPEKFIGLPQPAINDNPRPFIYLSALLTVASLVLLWRLEL
jgi:hypothetical protein